MIQKTKLKNFLASTLIPVILAGCVSEASTEKKAEKVIKKPAAVLTVMAVKAVEEEISNSLNVTGNIAAWDLMNVQPSASGLKITDIFVEENQKVRKGQLLIKLDDSVLKTQLLSAQAKLNNYKAQLSKARNPNRSQDISRQQAILDQAKANLDNAQLNEQRYETLYSQGAVSRYDLDTRKTALETAQAMYNQQKQQLDLLNEGSRIEDIQISQSVVNDVEAQIKQLNVLIEQTFVTAPDDGFILERFAHLGDVVSTSSKLLSIVRANRFDLQAKVPEADLSKIKIGSRVEISSDADSNLKTVGKVRQIGPSVDLANRQAVIKIDLSYVQGMHIGQFVKGKINTGKTKTITVPSKAVIDKDGNNFVFTLKNDIAVLTPVQVNGRVNDKVQIKGLKSAQEIISDGAGFLKDGDRVRIIRQEANT